MTLLNVLVSANAYAVGYDHGEKYKGFIFNHKSVDESKAKSTCGTDDECVECIEHRADMEGLKGYEVVKCLKDPEHSY